MAERFDNFTDVPKLERLTGNIVIQLRDYADKINRALLWNHTWYAQYVELLKKTGFNLKLLKSEFEYSKNISGYEHYLTTNIFDYVKIASLFLAARKIRQEIDYAKTIFDDKNLADSDLCHGILKALACRNGAAYEEAYHAYSIVWSKKIFMRCVNNFCQNWRNMLLIGQRQFVHVRVAMAKRVYLIIWRNSGCLNNLNIC